MLTLLTNPLNVSLLSSQLLSAPAIWYRPDGLRTPITILGIFNSATVHIFGPQKPDSASDQRILGSTIGEEQWVAAIIKGADDHSPRWRHLLPLGGLLLGIAAADVDLMYRSLRQTIGGAFVKAVNLTLQSDECEDPLATKTLTVVLSHVFDLLNDYQKVDFNHDLLLPQLYRSPFFDHEGLHSGYFLSTMDADVVEVAGAKFDWSSKSSTYVRMQRMASGQLIASLGSISQLIAYSTDRVHDAQLLVTMIEDLGKFARGLCIQWRQNKLSEIDITEETTFLTDETLSVTLPLLRRVLKSSMFATIVVLRSVLGRVLGDARLSMDTRK